MAFERLDYNPAKLLGEASTRVKAAGEFPGLRGCGVATRRRFWRLKFRAASRIAGTLASANT